MHEVKLLSFPHERLERLERVVAKHNRRLDHHGRKALLHGVEAGTPAIVARYAEEHAAHNVALEYKLLGATTEVAEAVAAAPVAAA